MGSTRRGRPGDLAGLEGLLFLVGDDNGVARCVDDEAAGAAALGEVADDGGATAEEAVLQTGSVLMGSRPLTDLTTMR